MNDPVPKPQQTEPRQVRVFVSSTFHDMQAERDALVKRVFPELRRRCRGLQVEFVGVDLRWGITEEQAARGEVLPVCFAEIEKCRPYFVGLLGDRYGSSLPRIPEAIVERHPWLERFRQRSATELEIRHAVLEGGRPAVRAMFYFRRSGKAEHGGKAKIEAADAGGNPERLLEGLKEDIRRGGFPVREDYADVGTLENWLLEDLWRAIREDFPEAPALSPLEQQRREQVAFAGSRTRNYAARDGDFEHLNRAGRGADPCLMVTGEAGIGKSALLANWMERFRKEHPEVPVVAHFTGASQEAGEPVAMLRRLTEELSALAGAAAEPPAQWHSLASAFGGQLAAAAAKGPFVLLLDGLDQLAEDHNAPDLGWLPRFLPENVRLVVSALEGRALAAWTERGWPVMTLDPLDTDQRRRLIAGYLARHGRSLGAAMVDEIVGDERSANPLYLTVLMEELMVFGYHKLLGKRVGYYLRARNTVEMYDLMLERIEGDCDGARPGLTREALSLLWAARRGLGEEEIRECLGSRESPLQMAYWSPLFLALGEAMIARQGRLDFFHKDLRQAVERRYLADAEARNAAHLRLARYFENDEDASRRLDEWPHQLFRGGDFGALLACVTTPDVFESLGSDARIYELDSYWTELEKRFDLEPGCQEARARIGDEESEWEKVARFEQEVGRYFSHRGQFQHAGSWLRRAAGRFAEKAGPEQVIAHAECCRHLGSFLMHSGQPAEAEPVLARAVELLDTGFGTEHALGGVDLTLLAEVRRSLGKYGQARADYEAGLARVEKALGRDHAHTATIRSNYAGLLLEMADFATAERLYREAFEDTTRALGPNHPHAAHILSNLASTLVHAGRPAEAEPLHQRAVRILSGSIGADNPYTLTAKANLAHVLSALGRATEAEALTREILVQRERIHGPGHPEVASTRESLARLLAGRCEYAEAEKLYLEALPVLETFYGTEHRLTADCMTALAQLYHNQGKHAEAEPYYRRSLEGFDRLLGVHHIRTVAARMSLGNLLSQRGALDESAAVCGAAVQALEEFGQTGHFLYAQCLNACGITLRKQGRLVEAEAVLGRAIAAYEASQGKDHAATGIGLKAMADLRVDQGRLAEAEQLMERSLAILEKALGPEHPNTLAIAKRPLEELRARIEGQTGAEQKP